MATLPSLSQGAAPLPNAAPSGLLDFAQSLDAAVNLARQSRNASAVGIMAPYQGTVAASDFGSILGSLNKASDTTATDLVKKATELNTPKYDRVSIGGDLYEVQTDSKTGQTIGQPRLLLKGKDTSGGSTVDANYNGEFGATVDLVGNAFGTNQQRTEAKTLMKNFIASGDYASAYSLVQQATSSGLKGEAASRFQNQANTLGVLSDLRKAIDAYGAAGGNTNIFKGTADQVQTKIGQLMTDPKYAALAVQLNAAFQNYRLQMTGAAFGPQESAEYASILPAAGNSLDLNLAKLQGAENYFKSSMNSSIKSVVGQGGVYIRERAEGAGAPASGGGSSAPAQNVFTSQKGNHYVLPN